MVDVKDPERCVQTHQEVFRVHVLRVIREVELRRRPALISMNVIVEHTTAAHTPRAPTFLALSTALVRLATQGMARYARTSMSV
jgi:hypothetical protein